MNEIKNGEMDIQRENMVERQLAARGITDRKVLEVMGRIKREEFVPSPERERSYYDGPLPIGSGQTISQPFIVAYMTEILELSGSEKVLELGTGSGYQTAVLAEMCGEVFTIELIPRLAENARILLTEKLGYRNIRFRTGNGSSGWKAHAPFHRIILTAAPERLPEALFEQLDEGGIIIAPVGGYFQNLRKYTKRDGEIFTTDLIAVSFVPFII